MQKSGYNSKISSDSFRSVFCLEHENANLLRWTEHATGSAAAATVLLYSKNIPKGKR